MFGIGCATENFSLERDRMVGWNESSYGYHSDDGGIFCEAGRLGRSKNINVKLKLQKVSCYMTNF